MGLILDTSSLIASERRGDSARKILGQAKSEHGEVDVGLSAVSIVELTHGIYRARNEAHRLRRRIFAEGVFDDLIVHPFTLEITQLTGRIEGEQAAQGNIIPFEDLAIGCTALHLGFGVATLNVRHFRLILGLNVVQF